MADHIFYILKHGTIYDPIFWTFLLYDIDTYKDKIKFVHNK